MADADLDAIKQHLAATTLSWPQMVKRYGPDYKKWPQQEWFKALAGIDSLYAPVTPPPPPTPSSDYAKLVGAVGPDLNLVASKGVKQVRIDRGFLEAAEIASFYTAGGEVVPIACYNPWSDLRPSGTGDHYAPDTQARMVTWSQRQVADIQARFGSHVPAALEVWNEPWLPGFWNAGPNPANFLALCKAFAAEAWKVWPQMTILVSSDSGWGGWCDKLIAADTGKWLTDPRLQPTVHPYCNNQAPSATPTKDYGFQRYNFTYDAWKAHGHPSPLCWLTEFGWVTDTAGQHYGSEGPAVSEATQAQYIVDAYKIAHNSGKVARAYVYMLSPNQTWSYNELRADNSDKPVIQTVKNLIQNNG